MVVFEVEAVRVELAHLVVAVRGNDDDAARGAALDEAWQGRRR